MQRSEEVAVKYKATYIVEKVDKQGIHNARNFDILKSDHINKDKAYLNKYWNL